ncbi:MAG: YraN family protein [Patescibacteria group bacterium]
MYNQDLGQQGEQLIESYLTGKGYEILEQNYRKKTGEIDLIAKSPKKDEIVFIEVKTRKSGTYGRPEEAVDLRKLKKIEKTALLWLNENGKTDVLWRIDVIALELQSETKITHLENVSL